MFGGKNGAVFTRVGQAITYFMAVNNQESSRGCDIVAVNNKQGESI